MNSYKINNINNKLKLPFELFHIDVIKSRLEELKEEDNPISNFYELDKVTNKIVPLGYKVKNLNDVNKDMELFYGINIEELAKNNPSEAENTFIKYVNENIDVVMDVQLLAYSRISRKAEGYFTNVPTTEYDYVENAFGKGSVVAHKRSRLEYVPSKDLSTTHVGVKFLLKDLTTKNDIWILIDEEIREGGGTKQNNLFKNILRKNFNEFSKKVERANKK